MSIDRVFGGTPNNPTSFQAPGQPALGLDFSTGTLYVTSKNTPGWVLVGGGSQDVPVVQGKLQAVNATTPLSVSVTTTSVSMFAISISLESVGTASAGHLVSAELTWVSPETSHNILLTLPLDSPQLVMETYPILCAKGTVLTFNLTYAGGAIDDPYTVSIRLVQMP